MPGLADGVDTRTLPLVRRIVRGIALAIAGTFALVISSLVVGFIVWDVLYFQPQRPYIAQLTALATEEERNPPEIIVRLMRADTGGHIALRAYWVLVGDPTNPTKKEYVSNFRWQMRGLLWWMCMRLHLSEHEQVTLIASRSYMGRDMRGYSAASQAIFKRPLALLSLEEAATLVAIPHCVNCYHRGSTVRRDRLLSRLQAGH
jgi:hypothetical protein